MTTNPQDTIFVILVNDVSKAQIGQSLRSWDDFNLLDKEMLACQLIKDTGLEKSQLGKVINNKLINTMLLEVIHGK